MTADDFRKLALSFPETSENSHMDHPDFRVGGKIFASLGPDEVWGMAKLTLDQQAALIRSDSKAFHPANGAWGKRGATIIQLRAAKKSNVKLALNMAWRNTAPAKLVKEYDESL